MASPLLQITTLNVSFRVGDESVLAVRDLDLALHRGQVHGLAGESGSGKSTVAKAVLGLLPSTATVSGALMFDGRDWVDSPPWELRRIRGKGIGYVPQEASLSLNPYRRIGAQIIESLRVHTGGSERTLLAKALAGLSDVGFSEPRSIYDSYPHQLSLGMSQRTLIAIALCVEPKVLVADEPTASLDAVTAGQVADLLAGLSRSKGLGILLISHDYGVLFRVSDRVTVMYAGQSVEDGLAGQIRHGALHPYTQALLKCRLSEGNVDARQAVEGIRGEPPDLRRLPSGCSFHPRCIEAVERCSRECPALLETESGRLVRCHLRHNDGASN